MEQENSKENHTNTIGRNTDPIPLDLAIDILTSLPVKSLVRFQCVSKLWSSIIRRGDFIDSFLAQSSARSPPLIISIHNYKNACIFLSPQPKNPGEKASCVPSLGLRIPKCWNEIISLRGLICFPYWLKIITHKCCTAICNPCTRQLIAIPECKPKSIAGITVSHTYFGYDAVNGQYRVLRIIEGDQNGKLILEHHVFVLGAGDSWRNIQGIVSHFPLDSAKQVHINGVLYYGADNDKYKFFAPSAIVRFDVRSEEFKLIKAPAGSLTMGSQKFGDIILINYEGKLTIVDCFSLLELGYFDFWVLEDEEKGEWSKMSRVMPPCWKDIFGDKELLYFQGTTHTGEIIIAPLSLSDNPPHVFFYDLKRNSLRRVEMERLHDQLHGRVVVFNCLDLLDSILFLEDCSIMVVFIFNLLSYIEFCSCSNP